MNNTAERNLNILKKKKQLEPEGLPKRNIVPVERLSCPAGHKKNTNKVEL